MRRGTNLGRLGDFNQAVIFESIRRAKGGISRVELAESTGLSPQTISNVVRRLIDDSLIREDRTVVSGPGKPRTVLELEADRLFSIGIDLDPAVITAVMMNLRGDVVACRRVETPDVGVPEDAISLMADAVEELITEAGQPRERIVGVGVAAPGPLDPREGVITGPPLLDGWRNVEIVKPLSARLGLRVILEKDTIAAALAELWSGDHDVEGRNFVCVYFGAGVGVGTVVGGEVLRGVSNNAGEIGHYSVGRDNIDCPCGRTGCLAAAIGFENVARKAEAAGIPLGVPAKPTVAERSIGMNHLVELARDGNPAALELIGECSRNMADMVAQLVNALDVDTVILGGPMWARVSDFCLEQVTEIINERFTAKAIHGISVLNSALGESNAAIGGACAVLDTTLSPKASALLLR